MTDEMRKKFDEMRKKQEDEITAVLTADQQKRLKEIQVQLAGNNAILDAMIQKKLALTDAQKAKVAALQKSQRAANQSVMENVRSGAIEFDQARESFQKNTKVMKEELGKVLTADQAKALADLGGKPFKATEQDRFGGGN